MTKKLSQFEKNQRKMKRQSLIYIKNLLKDKDKTISISIDYGVQRAIDGLLDTGQRKMTLEWREKPKRSWI